MKKSRFSESQIVAILKEGDAGVPVAQVLRQHGISQATYYNWKAKYGGASVAELKRLRELEAENAKLNACMRIWRWRMRRSRTFCPESCNAVCQARGDPGSKRGTGAAGVTRLHHSPAVAGGVLPAGGWMQSRPRDRCCAERNRSGRAAVGLLEVLRSAPAARPAVESQTSSSGVLPDGIEPGQAGKAPATEARAPVVDGDRAYQRAVGVGLHARCPVLRPRVSDT